MDPVADARALVAERFPAAVAAFLGPGILSDLRTATSDLDIVVVLPGPPAPYRESLRWRGWPAELFVHDADSLERYFAKDTARRRPTLARLCTDGVVLSGGQDTTDQIRERGRSLLAAGPPPLTTTELDLARYGLTDLLDDLAGSTDPAETAVIGWHVWTATAELALLLSGHWLGTSKWLVRELRAADPALAGRFAAAIGTGAIGTGAIGEQGQQLTELADEVLDRAGGRFWAGLRVSG
ncbi:MAG TPA: hypothetical protein VGH96_07450 [Streptosporangiaceae bacterium]|jgi:hypothetical protein